MKIHLEDTIAIAHRLYNPEKDGRWNKNTFGKCYEDVHGHNFKIEVDIEGEVNNETGMIVNFEVIKSILRKYDHHNLNNVFEGIPTAENLVEEFLNQLSMEFAVQNVDWTGLEVKVWETEKAYAAGNLYRRKVGN